MHRLAFLCLLVSALVLIACAETNPEAPAVGIHPKDGSYLDGSLHGPDAKRDLTFCQVCHGEAGLPGDNPSFNVGIESAGGNGCEGCHGDNLAHPQNWAGVNSTFHYSAGNVQEACTLCHGLDLDGVGGVGPTCLGCHESTAAFTLDCAFCHGYPPDGTLHSGTVSGVDHSAVSTTYASIGHAECTFCHGMSESAAGGALNPAPYYSLFNKATEAIGDHWDGNIQMNAELGYSDTNSGCAVILCHLNDPIHRMTGSGLPVVLKYFFD